MQFFIIFKALLLGMMETALTLIILGTVKDGPFHMPCSFLNYETQGFLVKRADCVERF